MENNLEEAFDPETADEIEFIVEAMYDYRDENGLVEPSEAEVQDLIEEYLAMKEGAYLYDLICHGNIILDVTADGIELIDTETNQPITSAEPPIDKKKLN
jgi:hypothetical protein